MKSSTVELQFSFVKRTRLVDQLLPIKKNQCIKYLKKARTPFTNSFDGLIFSYLASILTSHVRDDSDLTLSTKRNNIQIKDSTSCSVRRSPTVVWQLHKLASSEAARVSKVVRRFHKWQAVDSQIGQIQSPTKFWKKQPNVTKKNLFNESNTQVHLILEKKLIVSEFRVVEQTGFSDLELVFFYTFLACVQGFFGKKMKNG